MRKPELLVPASSLEVKDGGHLWSGCRLHWRRSIWTACKSQEFFDGRYERGHCLCP